MEAGVVSAWFCEVDDDGALEPPSPDSPAGDDDLVEESREELFGVESAEEAAFPLAAFDEETAVEARFF